MRLIFEKQEPLLLHRAFSVIHLNRDDHRAGIVLLRLLLIGQLPLCLELLHADNGKIHEAGILVRAVLIHLCPRILIALEGGLHRNLVVAVRKGNIAKLRRECGVPAVIRPVGIQHADLGHRGIAADGAVKASAEIILNQLKVCKGHGKTEGLIQLLELLLIFVNEAVENNDVRRFLVLSRQRFRLLHAGLAGIHRIDQIGFDAFKVRIGNVSGQDIGLCRLDNDMRIGVQQLNALHGRIGSLVKLTGKRFYRKNSGSFRCLKGLQIQIIHRRLREHASACGLKDILPDVLHIVTNQKPQSLNAFYSEKGPDLFQLLRSLDRIGFLLLHIDSFYITHSCCLLRGAYPGTVVASRSDDPQASDPGPILIRHLPG